jgi:hypothetical protein
MIDIRTERPGDISPVREINLEAFEQPAEADIVDRLRRGCPEALSLVAAADGVVKWLAQKGRGFPLENGQVAPIVPAADGLGKMKAFRDLPEL